MSKHERTSDVTAKQRKENRLGLRRWMTPSILFIFVSTLVILSVIFYINKHSDNQTGIPKVKQEEELHEHFYQLIPGLKRAESSGNVYELDYQLTLPEERGSMNLTQIWYSHPNIYIFYSIEGDLPTEITAGLKWETDHLESYRTLFNLNRGEQALQQGITYKNRYYNVLKFSNMNHLYDADATVTHIPLTLFPQLNYHGQQVELEAVPVELTYDPDLEKSFTIPLTGDIDLAEHGRIMLQQLILEPQATYLTFDYIGPTDDHLDLLAGTLTIDSDYTRRLWTPLEPTGNASPYYQISFEALDSIPSDISIKLEGMRLVTEESLSFEVEVTDFHGKLTAPGGQKDFSHYVGTVRGVDYYLDYLFWDERGLLIEMYKDIQAKENAIHNISSSEITFRWQEQQFKNIDKSKNGPYHNWRFPNMISVTNEQGIAATVDDFGSFGGTGRTGIGFFINSDYVEASNRLVVTLSNIAVRVEGPWKGKAKVKITD